MKKYYKIKPEFIELWGNNASEDHIVTENEVEWLASEWGNTVENLFKQLEEIKNPTIRISTTKYNEVNPREIENLIHLGAEIIKSEHGNGVFIGKYVLGNGYDVVKVYSDDDIKINNVILPLSIHAEYDREIVLNI